MTKAIPSNSNFMIGNPDIFAFETSEISKEACLRIYLNGKIYGDFKKRDELIDSVNDCKKLIKNINELNEDLLGTLEPAEIFRWLLKAGAERRWKYVRFLGEQMDYLTMFSYEKNGKLEWAFYNNRSKSPKIKTEQIEKEYALKVCIEYINWYTCLE